MFARVIGLIGVAFAGLLLSPAPSAQAASDWSKVAVGEGSACAIRVGKLYCWGLDDIHHVDDEPGSGIVIDSRLKPTRFGASTRWTSVSVGKWSKCGITSGRLYCWGLDDHGLLGRGDQGAGYFTTTSARVGTYDDWKSVHLADHFACAIRVGKLYCWGSLFKSDSPISKPTLVSSLGGWLSVSGTSHACGLRRPVGSRETKVYCWGENGAGQVGDGTTTYRSAPKLISQSTDWHAITGGDGYSCGIRTQLYCWGANSSGQLGDGTTVAHLTPKSVGTSTGWDKVTAGTHHTCGIRNTRLYCWGENGEGQLGNGGFVDKTSPGSRLRGTGEWTAVSASPDYRGASTCALEAGRLYCWGNNDFGQLGNGTTDSSNEPVQVTSP
jgi:alpha-tubulin suppressor-like RCC1 family protein